MAFGATCLLLLAVLLTAVHIGSSEAYAGATRSTISHTILVPLMMANAPDAEGTSELPTPQPNTKRDFKLLSIGLLSFDGGGIKGVLSTRLMAYALQYLLTEQSNGQKAAPGHAPAEKWQKLMVSYVEAFEPCFDSMWIVWAQQLDSMKIEPQVKLPNVKKWMDLSYTINDHKEMIRSILRIDLAYEFYIAHVLAISGTSTGGIIAAGTMLRMTLTQLIAMYMDPKICNLIFQSSFWKRPGAGLWQAKYLQCGVEELVDRVLRWIAPCGTVLPHSDKPTVKFVEAAGTFNACIKARILGAELPAAELNRITFTLRQAKEHYPNIATGETWVEDQISAYQSRVKIASEFLKMAKKRFKVLEQKPNDHKRSLIHLQIDKDPNNLNGCDCATKAKEDAEVPSSYDNEFFATRFLITSRCVNNGAAVVFDSHEPLTRINNKKCVMTGRGALKFGADAVLDVQRMQVKDVIMATSAAPYYFPAHEVEVELRGTTKTKLFFHDGGVMANDPGLINACINYRHFTRSNKPGKRCLPMFRLFRVGCGKMERWEESPVGKYTPQGANIVTSLADIFMSSDTQRTNLLASILKETYVLQDFKLDSYVPTGRKSPEIPMDQSSTIDLVNDLFAQLHPDLATRIAIPESALRQAVEKLSPPPKDMSADSPAGGEAAVAPEGARTGGAPEGMYKHAVERLVVNLKAAAEFLRNTESPKATSGSLLEETPGFVDAII